MKPATKTIIVTSLIILAVSISFQVLLTPVEGFAWFVLPIIFAVIGGAVGGAATSGGTCNVYTAPSGGTQEVCSQCQSNPLIECTEYKCKTLGQSCEFLTKERKCVAVELDDAIPPRITSCEAININLAKFQTKHTETGCKLIDEIPEFDAVFVSFKTDEFAQCRWSPNIGKDFNAADKESVWLDEAAYTEEHLFGISIANVTEELLKTNCKGGEECSFYFKCRDRRENAMLQDYTMTFKVKKGADLQPPIITQVSVPSGVSISSTRTSAEFYMFVDDASGLAGCKYSKSDKSYQEMESQFTCSNLRNIEEQGYECKTTFNLTQGRDNLFYIRCQDNSERANKMEESYQFLIKYSQPLEFNSINIPSGVINKPAIDLSLSTNNQALCYYSLDSGKEILLNQTDSLKHSDKITIDNGNHNFILRCIDLAGNEQSEEADFKIEYTLYPKIKRVWIVGRIEENKYGPNTAALLERFGFKRIKEFPMGNKMTQALLELLPPYS